MLVHRSPAFTAIYNEIKNSDRNRVLDLGPMSGGCFRLFSQLSCKIHVEDIVSLLQDHLRSDEKNTTFDISITLTEEEQQEQFDVILAWDLFNYLSLQQIQQLFEALKPFCKPNTLLYMLRYVEKNIPQVPRDISVRDQYTIEFSDGACQPRVTENYSTLDLLKVLPGYYMQDTLLAQEGMMRGITEHVLRYSPSAESRHLISKSESSRKRTSFSSGELINAKQHLSPSVAEVMSLLQSADDFVVLDLSSASNRAEDEIVEKSGSYFRIDVFSALERARRNNTEELNLSVLSAHMTRKYDVILAWDLFNFCTPSQILQLNHALTALCHSNTFLLSFMYTGRSRPKLPSKFEVRNGCEVSIESSALEQASESVTGVTLLRQLQGFLMDKTYAYREGMDRDIIEYIFGYNEKAESPALQQTSQIV